MERFTIINKIEQAVEVLNEAAGIKEPEYNKIGSYMLDFSSNGFGLERVISEKGGTESIIPLGTKKELMIRLSMYINGFVTGAEFMKERILNNG